MHFKWMLTLWDIGSDIALCISIFQNVGPASWMPWISIFAIVCGLILELYMTWSMYIKFKDAEKLSQEAFTELKNGFLNYAFFLILLLEDLPQIAVVAGYRAYSPKEPGTYNYYLEFVTFATSILSIFSKTTTIAW